MSWIGGKKALREVIVSHFPADYSRYVEVFGGAGWVLFHKPPGNDVEIYNDCNRQLANLYRWVQDEPEALIRELTYSLNSRADFERIRALLAGDAEAGSVKQAAWFYRQIRYSYASGLKSFGGQPHDIWSDFPLILQASRRLGSVVVENRDFRVLIPQEDRPETFFYCDPPYHNTEGYYQNVGEDGFTEREHLCLRDLLLGIRGKFLLSYNDDGFIRELYDQPGISLMEVHRINNMRQRFEGGSRFSELLIANYDLRERETLGQTSLFQPEHKEDSICDL